MHSFSLKFTRILSFHSPTHPESDLKIGACHTMSMWTHWLFCLKVSRPVGGGVAGGKAGLAAAFPEALAVAGAAECEPAVRPNQS